MRSWYSQHFPWTTTLLRSLWPHRPARRKRWVVLAGILLLLGLAHTAWTAIASSRLVRATERAAEIWGPMSATSLAPDAVPDVANAAKPVRAATEMLVGLERRPHPRANPVKAVGTFLMNEPTAADLATVREASAANALTFLLLDTAIERPETNWQLPYRRGVEADLPPLMGILNLARLNAADGRLALREGRVDDVVRAIRRGAAVDRSLRSEPMLLVQLTRVGIHRLNVALAHELVATTALDPEQLERVTAALEDTDSRRLLRSALIGETKVMVEAMLATNRGSLASWVGDSSDGVLVRSLRWLAKPFLLDNARAYVEFMENVVECAELPRHERVEVCSGLDSQEDLGAYHAIARIAVVNFDGVLKRIELRETRSALANVALALERHRLTSGRYPQTLDALAPAFDGTVPSDPLTGGPFVYVPEADGFQLTTSADWSDLVPRGIRADPVLDWTVRREGRDGNATEARHPGIAESGTFPQP